MDAITPFTIIIAIDPGTAQSALIQYRPYPTPAWGGPIAAAALLPNAAIVTYLRTTCAVGSPLAIEMIAGFGKPVGKEIFQTCVWIGKFLHEWCPDDPPEKHYVYRRDVKRHLCNDITARDTNVRQALIDRFGPGKQKAIGLKKTPGPLYGLKSDMWQALGVAVYWADTRMEAPEASEACEAVSHG